MLENRECVVLGESEKLHNLPWGKKRVSEGILRLHHSKPRSLCPCSLCSCLLILFYFIFVLFCFVLFVVLVLY